MNCRQQQQHSSRQTDFNITYSCQPLQAGRQELGSQCASRRACEGEPGSQCASRRACEWEEEGGGRRRRRRSRRRRFQKLGVTRGDKNQQTVTVLVESKTFCEAKQEKLTELYGL